MSTPSILYQNLLAVAAEGRRRGDGTIYAWGTVAVPDQANKTFDLTGITLMTDLGADADDKLNGYELIFDDGGEYLITDWVTSTKLASTFERPRVGGTGSFTIRRALFTNDFATANPLRYSANGRRYQKWIDKAANNAASIFAALPNGVDDGGFEKNSLTDYWTALTDGDGSVTINSVNPILGTYDCLLNMGTTGANIGVKQPGKIDLKKGKTYGVIFKARRDTAETANTLNVHINYVSNDSLVDSTFSKINAEDTIASSGGTDNYWQPVLATTAAWEEAKFVVSEDLTAGDYDLRIINIDTTNYYDVYLTGIYLWEIGPTPASGVGQPDTLIIGNHNMAGGFAAASEVIAYRAMQDLTNWGGAEYPAVSIDLDAQTVDGNNPIYFTYTANASIFPIHKINLSAISGKTWEAGEIWIGKRWDWPKFISGDWDPIDGELRAQVVDTEGGIEVIEDRYEKQRRSGEILRITSAEKDNWEAFEKYCKLSKPFWYYHDRFTSLSQDPELLFMRNASKPRLPVVNTRFNANYSFIEVL